MHISDPCRLSQKQQFFLWHTQLSVECLYKPKALAYSLALINTNAACVLREKSDTAEGPDKRDSLNDGYVSVFTHSLIKE